MPTPPNRTRTDTGPPVPSPHAIRVTSTDTLLPSKESWRTPRGGVDARRGEGGEEVVGEASKAVVELNGDWRDPGKDGEGGLMPCMATGFRQSVSFGPSQCCISSSQRLIARVRCHHVPQRDDDEGVSPRASHEMDGIEATLANAGSKRSALQRPVPPYD
eukprot:scaffold631_cov318-Pavlova_lutheri.AAC.6